MSEIDFLSITWNMAWSIVCSCQNEFVCVCVCIHYVCVCVSVHTYVTLGVEKKKLVSPSWHMTLNAFKSFKSFPYFFSVKHFLLFLPTTNTIAWQDSPNRSYSFYAWRARLLKKIESSRDMEDARSKLGICCCPASCWRTVLSQHLIWGQEGKGELGKRKRKKNLWVIKTCIFLLSPFISILNCPWKGKQTRKVKGMGHGIVFCSSPIMLILACLLPRRLT